MKRRIPRRGIVIFIVVSWVIAVSALTYNYIENYRLVSNAGSTAFRNTKESTEDYIQGIALVSLVCLAGFGIPFVRLGLGSGLPIQPYNMNFTKKTTGKSKKGKEYVA